MVKITKGDIGKEIVTDEGWGEIVEVFPNGNILVEYPNRKTKIFTKTYLDKLGKK